MTEAAEQAIAKKLRWQADACRMLGSPLYGELLDRAVGDIEAHGPIWEILRGHEDDPEFSVLGLRMLGGLNRLAQSGRAPELATAYEASNPGAAWEALHETAALNVTELRGLVDLPVQTNEVGRCAGLLFGFLDVAAETGMPLRLLEAGASAGLNLRWDRYGYSADGFAWGRENSPLRLEFELEGKPGSLPSTVEIAERCGCDANPIDASTPEGRLTLLTYIWPDQRQRIARMEASLKVAAEVPVSLDRETASTWTERMLAKPVPGQATVLYHSIVSQYLSEEERANFYGQIQAAGERATAAAPLAWLRMEPADDRADLHLTTWPGGEERHLARVGYHGSPVQLL